MLRNRLICGINEPRIQCHLLAKAMVNFKRAMKNAQAMETDDRDTTHLQVCKKSRHRLSQPCMLFANHKAWKGPTLMQTVTGVVADKPSQC